MPGNNNTAPSDMFKTAAESSPSPDKSKKANHVENE